MTAGPYVPQPPASKNSTIPTAGTWFWCLLLRSRWIVLVLCIHLYFLARDQNGRCVVAAHLLANQTCLLRFTPSLPVAGIHRLACVGWRGRMDERLLSPDSPARHSAWPFGEILVVQRTTREKIEGAGEG